MEWYCYVGVLPGLWVWLFIGGWVGTLVHHLTDKHVVDPDDEFETAVASFLWPLVCMALIMGGLWVLLRGSVSLPDRMLEWSRNRNKLPKAKVVK